MATHDPTAADKLRQAAALIEEVARGLNLERNPCGHCNAPRFVNWAAVQAHEILAPMIPKLQRIARSEVIGELEAVDEVPDAVGNH